MARASSQENVSTMLRSNYVEILHDHLVGSLLDVPTHTVNMTILKTSHDLWQCPSMSPYDVSWLLRTVENNTYKF